MATTLYFISSTGDYSTGNNDAKLNGSTSGWVNQTLRTTRGSGTASISTSTVAGTTNGVEIASTGTPLAWISAPLDADVTISGSVTWNLWASESNMSANVAINGRLEVIDGATGAITLIDQTARTIEVAVTTRAVNNFSETPAAGVACKRGDRLRVRVFGDDAGTMASGFTFDFAYNGTTASADGDSFITLTENLTFVATPAGSQVFLTDTASSVATASVDREAWTSRGAGVVDDVTNSAAGWTSPVHVTDTAGGTVVDWFTKQLTAFTLGGAATCNIRGSVSNAAANVAPRVEIARVDADGTNATVWAAGAHPDKFSTSEVAFSFLVAGDDISVSAGQRLRIRLYLDDWSQAAMASGHTATIFYAGTSGGASGDTYVTFTQTLTENVAATSLLAQRPHRYHLIRR